MMRDPLPVIKKSLELDHQVEMNLFQRTMALQKRAEGAIMRQSVNTNYSSYLRKGKAQNNDYGPQYPRSVKSNGVAKHERDKQHFV